LNSIQAVVGKNWNHVIRNPACLDPAAERRGLLQNRDGADVFPVLSPVAIFLAAISVLWGIFVYLFVPVYTG